MRLGLAEVEAGAARPEFVLFTDADIAYAPHVLSRLVTIARAKNSVLTSLMVKLRCESAAERWLAPAFVFFFQMLYPFAWVNDPRRATAAAAGGCMLVRREALHAAGGLEAVRGALIDDCALGALMKGQGPIWLGLTESVDSLRAYSTFAEFSRMVSRSAFAELRYSSVRLAGAIGGMALVYLAPPLFAIFARGAAQAVGARHLGDDGDCARADVAALRSAPCWRPRLARNRRRLCRLHLRFRVPILAGARRLLERSIPGADAGDRARVTTVKEALSGKGHRDENFPVASWLLSEQRRGPIMAFYRFVRAADDVADHPTLTPETKLELLDDLDDALTGRGKPADEAEPLRLELARTGLSPKHALGSAQGLPAGCAEEPLRQLVRADGLLRFVRRAGWPFRSRRARRRSVDVAGLRRFVLGAADHQSFAGLRRGLRRLNRVYLPLDTLAAHGASVEMLDAPKAPPALRGALAELARRTSELVARGAPLIPQIRDVRLGAEIAAIHALARRLSRDLESRDPLSERVHLGKAGFALVGGLGAARFLGSAMMRSVGMRAKATA